MLAMVSPVPPGDAGLVVYVPSNTQRPNALSPGGLAVSPLVRKRRSTPYFRLWLLFSDEMLATISCIFSSRISGVERALPRPAYPVVPTIGADGWNGSSVCRPGMVFHSGLVSVVGSNVMLNCVYPYRKSPTVPGEIDRVQAATRLRPFTLSSPAKLASLPPMSVLNVSGM